MLDSQYKILHREAQGILSLEEVKSYLRISDNLDDNLLTEMIASAINFAENFLDYQIIVKKVSLATSNINLLILPLKPAFLIAEVKVGENILGEKQYNLQDNILYFDQKYPKMKVTYFAGLEDANILPSIIKEALKSHIALMYDRRGETDLFSFDVGNLYKSFRIPKI